MNRIAALEENAVVSRCTLEMLLINSSFVGGLGAARKTASLVKSIERRVNYLLFTDSEGVGKLELVGLRPDLVVTIPDGSAPENVYAAVRNRLSSVKYDAMISFGWRSYVPADAIERSKPVVIVDGGWPERFEGYPSPFWKDIYCKVNAYCLTNHFFSPGLADLPKHSSEVPFRWVFHPFQEDEVQWHVGLRSKLNTLREHLPYYEAGRRVIFLNMNPDYIDPMQGTFTGGWLNPKQLDECRGFVTRLLVELDSVKNPLSLLVHRDIARQFAPVIAQCRRLRVVPCPALNPEEHHIWRTGADLVLLRSTRSVGAAQVALSNVPTLHVICPTSDDYMGEQSSCKIAQSMGIAESIDHEAISLSDAIMNYLDSNRPAEVARKAQFEALSFWRMNGPDTLLELMLETAPV